MNRQLTKYTIFELSKKLIKKEISSFELTKAYLKRIDNLDTKINAFLYVNYEESLKTAKEVDKLRIKNNNNLNILSGIPIAIKDLITTIGQPTTAGSKMLSQWYSPYEATVIRKIRMAKMPILGKTNLDEFGMGSSTEYSAFGPTKNPWNLNKIPGGSSGGSAAAIAAYLAPCALGTDTGGSVRQPAAMSGIVGVKPTYGEISRYGVIAMASSLDQVGPMARTVFDTALLHDLIKGHDPFDSTSLSDNNFDLISKSLENNHLNLGNIKIGIIKEIFDLDCQKEIRIKFINAINKLNSLKNVEVLKINCPNILHSLDAYHIIMSAEASSNLSRYDGLIFGLCSRRDYQKNNFNNLISKIRANGFGKEVKRRIILGTYILSSGYHNKYYFSAQKMRNIIKNDFVKAFNNVDILISPTSLYTACSFKHKNNPQKMHYSDIATASVNLAGLPAISMPIGFDMNKLPIGIQLIAPFKKDKLIYQISYLLEKLLKNKNTINH